MVQEILIERKSLTIKFQYLKITYMKSLLFHIPQKMKAVNPSVHLYRKRKVHTYLLCSA